MAAGILVWSDRPVVALELLGKARQLADATGGQVSLCLGGDVAAAELEVYASSGADVVYSTDADHLDSARWAAILATAMSVCQPTLVLIGASKMGMDVAPRVAERAGAAYAAWAVDVTIDPASGETTASCVLYGGAGLASYRFVLGATVLTVAEKSFEATSRKGRLARAETLQVPAGDPELSVVSERAKTTSGARLEEAKAVVDVGRGVKEMEHLEMIRRLASLLGGQVGCSRPVSSDRDWLPEWLGLSGIKVKPEVCLTVGISGAIQHVVGIRDSRVVAAVNNDEDAAIFTQADIGIVADLNEFLPVLIDRLQTRGVHPVWL